MAGNFFAGLALRKGGSVARRHLDKRLAAHGLSTADITKILARRESFGTRLAAAVLALSDTKIAKRLDGWRARQTKTVANRPKD